MLSNPPYGKSWSSDLDKMGGKKGFKDQRFLISHGGNSEYSLVTRTSDGQMLFLANMASKMKHDSPLGSRIAEVHNGSSLFTGDAGQGESNIRRWIIENNWLEAIVALPLNMFYNTGIATYIWVLTNRKPEHRKGKVQLIDATKWFTPLRKNLGQKNCELSPENVRQIIDAFMDFGNTEQSRIFPNEAFGYWKVTVERPLRLAGTDPERVYKAAEIKKLKAENEKDGTSAPIIKKILPTSAEANPLEGRFAVTLKGNPATVEYEPDTDLRDTEQVALLHPGGIEAFLREEVLPYTPDAWYNPEAVRTGYEINFNRHFYEPQPMPILGGDPGRYSYVGAGDRGVNRSTDGLLYKEEVRRTMEIQHCCFCGKAITSDYNAEEHIIPNAIGGRRRVVGFICRDCNSRSGERWDDELARQLAPICVLLRIKRQRGHVAPQRFRTSSGGSIRINPDGTMVRPTLKPQVKTEGSITSVHIEASTMGKLRRMVQGLRRKYPQLRSRELEELVSEAQDKSFYSSDLIEIPCFSGGPEFGRAMVKSALALVFDAGIDPKQCDLALDYLLREGKEACFGYYYEEGKDMVANRPTKTPFHCVYVKGCSENSTIVGYVEFFSMWRTVLCLSQSYSGPDFTHVYAIDPVKGDELDISVNFDLTLSDIQAAYEYEKFDEPTFIDAISRVFDVIHETDFDRALARVIDDAVRETIAVCGAREGDYMTDEQIWDFTQELVARVMPFMIHNVTPKNFPLEFLPFDDEG